MSDADRQRMTFMFGANSCANAAGTMKCPRWWNAEKRRQEWLIDRRSRRRFNSSTLTKDVCRILDSVGAARRLWQHLFSQRIDSLGQTKIKLGQPAFAVR